MTTSGVVEPASLDEAMTGLCQGEPSLPSFGPRLSVAVVGATGGLGGALTHRLADLSAVERVVLLSRTEPELMPRKGTWAALDLLEEDTIAEAAAHAAGVGELHLVIVASGILHDDAHMQPEKTWRALDREAMFRAYEINTIGPALVGKHFLPLLARKRKSVFAPLSARVGSIGDNRSGGWHAYRTSKAALNMLIKNFALELAYRNPGAICVGLHPGTVDTSLSRPFQGNVPKHRLFSPDQSAEALLKVLDGAAPEHSGRLLAWDGTGITP